MNAGHAAHRPGAPVTRPCPGDQANHQIIEPDEDARAVLGLPEGRVFHVDRTREPGNGDLVWVELVRHGSTQRLVRRYARDSGWVTLSAPGGGSAAVMRRQGELLVLGVVDDAASCAAAASGG